MINIPHKNLDYPKNRNLHIKNIELNIIPYYIKSKYGLIHYEDLFYYHFTINYNSLLQIMNKEKLEELRRKNRKYI